jgi:hypothetical protein
LWRAHENTAAFRRRLSRIGLDAIFIVDWPQAFAERGVFVSLREHQQPGVVRKAVANAPENIASLVALSFFTLGRGAKHALPSRIMTRNNRFE